MQRLEEIRKVMLGEKPAAPIMKLLGINITGVEKGNITLEMEVSERMHNPMGTLHGGVLCDLADVAMGYAFISTLDVNELFTTVEMKTNFLKPVWEGKLRAESKIIKKGRTMGLVECNIYDEQGSLVAYSTSTCTVIKGNKEGKRYQE